MIIGCVIGAIIICKRRPREGVPGRVECWPVKLAGGKDMAWMRDRDFIPPIMSPTVAGGWVVVVTLGILW